MSSEPLLSKGWKNLSESKSEQKCQLEEIKKKGISTF